MNSNKKPDQRFCFGESRGSRRPVLCFRFLDSLEDTRNAEKKIFPQLIFKSKKFFYAETMRKSIQIVKVRIRVIVDG